MFYGWLSIANKNTTIKLETHTTNNKNSVNLAYFWAPIATKCAPKSKFLVQQFLGVAREKQCEKLRNLARKLKAELYFNNFGPFWAHFGS